MRADADAPPEVDLAPLVRASVNDVTTYVGSPAFPVYMWSGNRVRALVSAVYESTNAKLMALIIRSDKRDVKHSVAYLKAFRQALRDNRFEMALGILAEVEYPFDLLADVLQQDRNTVDILSAKEKHSAYLSVMKQFEMLCLPSKNDTAFFNDFCAYLIVAYTDENDLLSNLVVADSPHLLMYVADLDSDFGVRVFKEYVRWKYDDRENDEQDDVDLIHAVGRFSNARRSEVIELLSNGAVPKEVLQYMLQNQGIWQRTREEEGTRNDALKTRRQVLLLTNVEGVYTSKDVTTLALEVSAPEEPNEVIGTVGEFFASTVLGRYRHLLEK